MRRGTLAIVADQIAGQELWRGEDHVPGADTWWDVAPAEVSRSEVTQTLRSEYERDRAELQRFHY